MKTNFQLATLIAFMFLSSCSISNNFGKQQTKGLKHSGRHFSKDKIVLASDEMALNTEPNQEYVFEKFDDIAEYDLQTNSLDIDLAHSEAHDAKTDESTKPKSTSQVKRSYPIQIKTSETVVNHLKTKIRSNSPQPAERTAEGFGIASMIIAIVGWFLPLGLGILFCIVALIFSAISLSRIMNHPDKYKGSGFAITGLVLSIIGLLILLVMAA